MIKIIIIIRKSKRENPILIGNLSEINPITNDYFRDDIDRAINCRSDSDLLKLLLGLKPPGLVIGSRNLHNTIFQTFIKFDDLKKKRKCIEIKMDKLLDKLSVRFVIKNYGIPVSSLSHLSKIFMGITFFCYILFLIIISYLFLYIIHPFIIFDYRETTII